MLEPDTNEPYERDPRGTALKAEAFLKQTGIGDTSYFGPEAEFFIFDDVRFSNRPNKVSFEIDAVDAAWNTDTVYEMGNMGHRAGVKGGYFPLPPVDAAQDIRGEMLSTMKRMGMKVDKHHHEVASPQHELGLIFGSLTEQADNILKYKYVIQQVAAAYGKTATFMPKPYYGDNGSGMHVNMSICKGGKPVFAGDKYADLSSEALWFIGGILKHAKTINAFTNPTTNSYKRLIPGFEAPVLLAYSARNRSASIRIPWSESPKAKRVEARFPDPCANPYLGFAALLMAGIDGIRNKIDPGAASDKDLYDLPPEELAEIPTVCGSLREALRPRERPRVPAARRRLHQGPDRRLHRAEVARGLHDGAHAASGRIPDVLLALSALARGANEAAPRLGTGATSQARVRALPRPRARRGGSAAGAEPRSAAPPRARRCRAARRRGSRSSRARGRRRG